jgi:hypothetical protein
VKEEKIVMAIERITTPDGDKLRDTRTGKLAGSPPTKPLIPTVNQAPTIKGKIEVVVSLDEPSPVGKVLRSLMR